MSGSDEGEWLEVKVGLKAVWDGFLGLLQLVAHRGIMEWD